MEISSEVGNSKFKATVDILEGMQENERKERFAAIQKAFTSWLETVVQR